MNEINELEKEDIEKNKLELLNKKNDKIFEQTNICNYFDNKKNYRCIIY